MENKIDVTALGELLIDMTDNGMSEQGNTLFEANPGGAPCNVLSILNKLGNKTGFIGKVGDDIFFNIRTTKPVPFNRDGFILCNEQSVMAVMAYDLDTRF